MLLDDLDDNYKACGFCAQPVHETFKFSDVLLDFLEYYLDVKGSSLPTRVCATCFKGTKDVKLFKDKIIKSFTKLKTHGVSSSLIWGRSADEKAWLKKKFSGLSNGAVDYYGKFSPALTYDPEKYQLVLPSVVISPAEKALADSHVILSKSGRLIKKKVKTHDDEDDWAGGGDDWNYNVKTEATAPKKTEEEYDRELSDCGETFPSKGPYQCEICQNITSMKKQFVAHIKEKHMNMIDNKVLKTLEQDLEKRRKKICEKMGKKYVPLKRTYKKRASKPKKKKSEDTSDSDDGDDEFTPSKKRPKRSSVMNRGIDAEGNTLPPPGAAGKDPADCPICGKNISRLNEMGKHQSSSQCMKVRREKGIVSKDVPEDEEDSSKKTKKKKDEDAWEPGDWDDDYDADDAIHAKAAPKESAARVDDAIQEAVKASLETAAKELKETSSNGSTEMMGEYIDPAPQPDIVQSASSVTVASTWEASNCAVVETVVTTQHLARPWGSGHSGQSVSGQETQTAAANIAHNSGGVWSQFQGGFFHPQ